MMARSVQLCSFGVLWGFLVVGSVPAHAAQPNRFEKHIAAFERADQKLPQSPGQILFLGSSSIRKWDLPTSFPGLDALNRGFGGSQISDSIELFSRVVQPYQPRQIIFYAGDNDIAAKKSPETVHDDFNTFVKLLHQKLPETQLVFIAIKPSLSRWKLIEEIRQANALIREECEKDPLLTYLDVDAPMLNAEGKPRPELFVKDGLHMSPAGYAVWAEELRPLLLPDQRGSATDQSF